MRPRLSPPPRRGRTQRHPTSNQWRSSNRSQLPIDAPGVLKVGTVEKGSHEPNRFAEVKALNGPQNYVRSVRSLVSDDAEGLDGESRLDISATYLHPLGLSSKSLALLESSKLKVALGCSLPTDDFKEAGITYGPRLLAVP
ncbi:hypothetical protein M407DRAFT_35108 [Tulasnella calospora MUT 4182]|uniref:Uncharacterized protein n=1 Tax=Tulasnella calospora MUT 4182 TaxID=1051891 RepID=A0A0C3PZL8_9AGAM|nr:hypothetical protein M407DRAFT_35108 [Tulasnella calospora MUT 4182]